MGGSHALRTRRYIEEHGLLKKTRCLFPTYRFMEWANGSLSLKEQSCLRIYNQVKCWIWRMHVGLKRCGKSCRLRWLNYLRPDIKRGNISDDEEALIIRLHKLLGNRWSLIAGRLPGRTDNEIKNYWNTTLAKKLQGELSLFDKPCRTVSTPAESNSSCPATEPPRAKITTAASPPTDADSNMVRAFCGLDAPLLLPFLAPEGYSGSAMDMLAAAWPSDFGAWGESNVDGIDIGELEFESQRGDGIWNCQDLGDLMASEGATIGNWVEKDDPPRPDSTRMPSFWFLS